MFIDVEIGHPGRMHDARVFRLSTLGQRVLNVANPILPGHLHLIGDSAYPLHLNLMKPYQDNGHLTERQTIFNNMLSSIRSTIERAFGLLKIKFRRLKFLDVRSPDTAMKIVGAACVLHNYIIMQQNVDDGYDLDLPFQEMEQINNPAEEDEAGGAADAKRQTLMNGINL